MTYRILVTGSRDWTDKPTIRHAIFDTWEAAGRPKNTVLVSGACPTGADRYSEICGDAFGFTVERHEADWAQYRKGAGPKRNQLMVDLDADVCLAFPREGSKGTVDCIKRAEKAKIPLQRYKEYENVRLPYEGYIFKE